MKPNDLSTGKKKAAATGIAASSLALLGGFTLLAPPEAVPGDGVIEPRSDNAEPANRLLSDFVQAEWDLPSEKNERIDFFIDFLSGERHDDVKEWMERIGRYGPFIENELEERGMPKDLLFLAMIESGLDQNAYSKADAAGMWQFIEETGERYGLEVSTYVDERRDPIKATGAALSYMQDLHDRFGSWFLASAAYNTGENRIERILREQMNGAKGDENLYWQISSEIPRETRDYVPLMIAMGHIAKAPADYGFLELKPQEELRFAEVVVPGGTTFEEISSLADVSIEELKDLNAHLVKEQTPPDRAWNVRVSMENADRMASAFNTEKATPLEWARAAE